MSHGFYRRQELDVFLEIERRSSSITPTPVGQRNATYLEGGDLAADLRPPVLDVVVAAAIYLLGDLGEALVLLSSQCQQFLVLLPK